MGPRRLSVLVDKVYSRGKIGDKKLVDAKLVSCLLKKYEGWK